MTRRLFLVALLLTGAAAAAAADTPPPMVDLDAVLALARGASPRLAVARQGIAVAKAQRRTAGALPNPTVTYGQQYQGGNQTQFAGRWAEGASVELPLLLFGQRGARVKAADRGIEAARAQVTVSGNVLAADAGAAFVNLLAAQEKRAAVASARQEAGQLRDLVAGRQASGMASQYDLLRMDVEAASWRTRTAEAEVALANQQAQLAALLGFPDWRPLGAGELRPLVVQTEPRPLETNPAVVAARREEEVAKAGVEVARRERFPNVSVYAGRSATRGPWGTVDAVGVQVEIPIFDTRAGALDKAHAEAQTAGLQRRLVETEVQNDVERYSIQVMERSAALEEFRQRMGSRIPALKQMAEDAYRLGKSSILELLDALSTRYETRISELDLVAGLMEAQLRLQAARGELAGAPGAD